MSRFKKILIATIVVLALAQIPGIYSLYSSSSITRIVSGDRRVSHSSEYEHYAGVAHVHSSLGGHSSGRFEDLIEAASANNLNFVIMNEHVSSAFDTSAKTLREKHGKTIFVGGSELSSKDGHRFLVAEGYPRLGDINPPSNTELVDTADEDGRLLIQAYPEKSKGPLLGDGVEVFSLHTNSKRMNPALFLYNALWCYYAYPELTLARHFMRPSENLERYDAESAKRRVVLFSGVDAHSNIGLRIADDADNSIVGLKLDDYETIFGIFRNYVLVRKGTEFTKESLIEAIREGRTYTAIDVIGSGRGFDFYAEKDNERFPMGSEVKIGEESITLRANSPVAARFVIFHNGRKVFEEKGTSSIEFSASQKGAYRIEVYRDEFGSPFDEMPWILSNPVYIR